MKYLGMILAAIALAVTLVGCACVSVSSDERARINKLHERGISWSRERNAGRFQPPVDMTAAVFWSLLPGAGQHFIAHKMGESGFACLDSRDYDRCQLRVKGTLMLATSWFPDVYLFTLPCGILSGTIVDVNRINNLALLEWLERQGLPVKEQKSSRPIPLLQPTGDRLQP